MANDVAELSARRAQHIQGPAGLEGDVDEVGQRGLGRCAETVFQILVALAQDLQVQRQHQRRAVSRTGTLDETLDEVAVLHDVELKPERMAIRALVHILDGADAHRRQRKGDAEFFRCPGSQNFSIGVLHAGQACRGDRDRHRDLFTDHRGRRAALLHVDQDALAQLDLLKIALVGTIGAFGP